MKHKGAVEEEMAFKTSPPAAGQHQKRLHVFSMPGEAGLRFFPVLNICVWFRSLALYSQINFTALSPWFSDFYLIQVIS